MRQLFDWLEQVHSHARASYPEECCGAIVRSPEGRLQARPLRNIQNQLHADDPARHPRDGQHAYFVDPGELLRLGLAGGPGVLAAIYHSHNDSGAAFSEADLRQAAPGNQPLLPGVSYLVISVRRGEIGDTRLYAWREGSSRYEPVGLEALSTAGRSY